MAVPNHYHTIREPTKLPELQARSCHKERRTLPGPAEAGTMGGPTATTTSELVPMTGVAAPGPDPAVAMRHWTTPQSANVTAETVEPYSSQRRPSGGQLIIGMLTTTPGRLTSICWRAWASCTSRALLSSRASSGLTHDTSTTLRNGL